jgi:hypothetical protein
VKKGKHVIFLGAGASKQSGYPLANDLRLLISSRKKWEEALAGYEDKQKLVGRPITAIGMNYWDKHADALNLFRNGGFATIDEFCKLAGGFSFQKEIHDLRCLVRAALGLFNPEENFEKSEYYGFIQSLFKNDLLSLREDLTVLTYNYDPYLEFLLHRAVEHRFQVVGRGKSFVVSSGDLAESSEQNNVLRAVTSGFGSVGEQKWLGDENTKPSFCVLKLHGSIVHVANQAADYEVLFSSDAKQRAEKLFREATGSYMTPILFPWEIMTDKGFVEKDSFPFRGSPPLYSLFRGIWERARREVQAADKISFVGLSMHSFLFDGLKYLFDGKEGQVEVCVANPDTTPWIRGNHETYWQNHPHSSAYAVNQALKNIAPKMQRVGMLQGGLATDQITLVKDFALFVKTQIKPTVSN